MDAWSLPERFHAGVQNAYVTDAADLESLLGAATQCFQLSSGLFGARVSTAQAGALRVLAHDSNRALEIRRSVSPEALCIVYADTGDRMLEHGRPLEVKQMLAVSDREIDLIVRAGTELRWIDVNMPMEHLAGNRSLFIASESAAAVQLRSYVDLVLQISAGEPVRFHSEALRQRIESDLLARVDRALQAGIVSSSVLGERKPYSLIRSVESFMWEHVDEPITLQRICEHTNSRMRSLIYSFKDAFGIGPITYLKILRLNTAHRRLREARGGAHIFDIAAALGFWHMGHFSADYKRLFGTTASETAARKPIPRFKSRMAHRP